MIIGKPFVFHFLESQVLPGRAYAEIPKTSGFDLVRYVCICDALGSVHTPKLQTPITSATF